MCIRDSYWEVDAVPALRLYDDVRVLRVSTVLAAADNRPHRLVLCVLLEQVVRIDRHHITKHVRRNNRNLVV